jgi:hypothetical protein
MIETQDQRDKLRRLEKLSREERAARYATRMGTPEHMLEEHGLVEVEKGCPICEERKRKARERVKRYRTKVKG